jgi:hypothetical protein
MVAVVVVQLTVGLEVLEVQDVVEMVELEQLLYQLVNTEVTIKELAAAAAEEQVDLVMEVQVW